MIFLRLTPLWCLKCRFIEAAGYKSWFGLLIGWCFQGSYNLYFGNWIVSINTQATLTIIVSFWIRVLRFLSIVSACTVFPRWKRCWNLFGRIFLTRWCWFSKQDPLILCKLRASWLLTDLIPKPFGCKSSTYCYTFLQVLEIPACLYLYWSFYQSCPRPIAYDWFPPHIFFSSRSTSPLLLPTLQ